MIDLTSLFYSVDDFCKNFEKLCEEKLITSEKSSCKRLPGLALSEVMTLVIFFHLVGYRNFKTFYLGYVLKHLQKEFPNCPSYNRMVELKKQCVFPLGCYLMQLLGKCTGISFADSTTLSVCHPKRISNHKVFKKSAKRGKTSMGWFYGFKLHIVVNDCGELLAFMITPGNVDDRVPIPELAKKGLFGKLFADKGYISKELFEKLFDQGIQLITRLKKNMKNQLMSLWDKFVLRKRGIVETIIDQLKNISQVEHTRHRSPVNFLVNVFGALIAYSLRPKKPGLCLSPDDQIRYLSVS